VAYNFLIKKKENKRKKKENKREKIQTGRKTGNFYCCCSHPVS